jgi:hypothetical protein
MRTVDLSLIEKYEMPAGLGKLENNQACLVAQAAIVEALANGDEIKELTDSLECACPVLRVLAIALNDVKWWDSNKERTEALRPLIPMLLDSRVSPEAIAKRAALASSFAQKAAKSAKSAKYAAEFAAKSAEYAAEYAVEYAEYAAKSAVEYAKLAAEYAKYAVESAAELKTLRGEFMATWLACEAIKD